MNERIKGKLILSVMTGALFGIGVYLLFPMLCLEVSFFESVLVGVMFFSILMMVLMAPEIYINREYTKFEKGLVPPPLYRYEVDFVSDEGIRNGRIYICEDILVIISMDKKPYMVDGVLKGSITRCEVENHKTLYIYTTKFDRYAVVTDDAEIIREYMVNNGWIS